MFSFLSKNSCPVISKFANYKEQSRKCIDSQTKAFLSLQEWSNNGNNTAIHDVSTKLSVLFTKLDNDVNCEKMNALNEIIQLFEKFKEYDLKLSKLWQEIVNAEKHEKKREDELSKCPTNKNIRDFEVRLLRAKNEKEKLQLKYYDLSNETDVAKSILYKTVFLRYSEYMLKYNQAERVVFEGMHQLISKIPDISENDLRQLNYSNYNNTSEICNETCSQLNTIIKSPISLTTSSSEITQRSSKSRISKCKKVSTEKATKKSQRKSCQAYIETQKPYLYPSLEPFKNRMNDKCYSTSSFNNYLTIPSAPPKSDCET